jgi:hypothetical protein
MGGKRDALFENLHNYRDASLLRLADQHMEVLGHYHVTPNNELVFLPYFFENVEKQIAAAARSQKGLAMVAAAGYKVLLAARMKAAQSGWHGGLL